MGDPKQVILKILEIIEYQGEKEKFAADLLDAIYKKAISSLVGSLTDEQRSELESKLSGIARSPEEVSKVLFEYVSDKEYELALEKSSGEIMEEYLEAILPTISQDQKAQIKEYLSSF